MRDRLSAPCYWKICQIFYFSSCVTLKFDGWPWKTIGHLFYATSSFVHHFLAINEFKLELQSGTPQFGSKSAIFCPVRPWNLTDDLEETIGHLFYATSSYVHHFLAICEFKLELQSGNAQVGSKSVIFLSSMTLKFDWWPWKNNRAPLLCYFKLCASFSSHLWIQTGVMVRKRPNWGKICFDLCDLDLWLFAWTPLLSMVITSENFMMIQWQEHSEKGVINGRMERSVLRAAWSQLKSMST